MAGVSSPPTKYTTLPLLHRAFQSAPARANLGIGASFKGYSKGGSSTLPEMLQDGLVNGHLGLLFEQPPLPPSHAHLGKMRVRIPKFLIDWGMKLPDGREYSEPPENRPSRKQYFINYGAILTDEERAAFTHSTLVFFHSFGWPPHTPTFRSKQFGAISILHYTLLEKALSLAAEIHR